METQTLVQLFEVFTLDDFLQAINQTRKVTER